MFNITGLSTDPIVLVACVIKYSHTFYIPHVCKLLILTVFSVFFLTQVNHTSPMCIEKLPYTIITKTQTQGHTDTLAHMRTGASLRHICNIYLSITI